MSRFNNVTTANEYTPSATIENVPEGVQVSLHVFDKAVLYQIATGYPGGSWGAEKFLAPGFHVLARRASGVRVRSAAAGQPAQVTAEVATDSEVSWGETPPGDFHGSHTLRVDAAGDVTYDFDGHVSAQGLDLEAHDGLGTEPLPHSTIRWLREDAFAVAQAHGMFVLDDTGALAFEARAGDYRAGVEFLAQAVGTRAAELVLRNVDDPGELITRGLIDDLEQSSFVQAQEGGPRPWFLRTATVLLNLPNVPAASQVAVGLTGWLDPDGTTPIAPDVGDLILAIQPTALATGLAVSWFRPRCATAGQIDFVLRNLTGAAIDDTTRLFVAAWIAGAGLP